MSALTALAVDIGVPLLGRILTRRLGAGNAELVTDVIGAVANRLGVTPAEAEIMVETDRPRVIDAMREVVTCDGIFPPSAIRVRPMERTDDEEGTTD